MDDGVTGVRNDEMFRAVYEHAAIGISVVALDGRLIKVNASLCELLGYRPEELEGLHFTNVTHPEDAGRDLDLFQSLKAGTCDHYRIAKRYIRKDGRHVWAQLTVSLARDASGDPEYAIGMVEDVTEHKRAAGAMRESEERFRAIFQSAPIGIELADRHGKLTHTNAALQEMLGYTADELRNIDFTAITHPDDVAAEHVLDDELVTGGRDQYQLEKRHIRKDGQVIWTRLTATLVRNGPEESHFALGMVEDITERKRAEEALVYQSLHDTLTDLPNRALLQDRLAQALLRARRVGGATALLLMDLDRFKEVNDAFSHQYGDLLLEQIGARLCDTLRETDTVGRLGGDEFALVLPGTDRAGAVIAAQKLTEMLLQPFEVEGHLLQVTASIGIALYPDHSADGPTLLRQADVAMYVAKRAGGGYAFYAPEDDEHSPGRVTLVGELRGAIDHDDLFLQYQPKMDLATRRVEGVEALVRWRHPERGLITPDQFIGLAEHTGLIKPLTLWVLDEALRQCSSWHGAGVDLRVAVNLSPRSLQDPELVEMIAERLDHWQALPSWLELEITEGAIMADAPRALETLTALHEMGVGISIDDFGTGYSSLAYLKRLPVDEIKIDKSFILDMAMNEEETFIARSVIDLGHNLGMQVVAEGVENQRILDLLESMGCDQAQGFHLSRPLPASDVLLWLRSVAPRLSKSA